MTNRTRSRSDSPSKTCTRADCDNPLRARGLCSTHYKHVNPTRVTIECAACGRIVEKEGRYRRYRQVCSFECRAYLQFGARSCPVPDTHSSRSTPVPKSHPSRTPLVCSVSADHPSRRARPGFHAGYCADCGAGYVIASEWVTRSHYCSDACARRVGRRLRRAREHGASGSFTWDGFMKLTMQLGNCCAYCGGDNGGQPLEPDHVVPLSRGGHNGLTNILPSCRADNADKRDLLLSEWAADRARRGLPPRRCDTERFLHLVAHRHAA